MILAKIMLHKISVNNYKFYNVIQYIYTKNNMISFIARWTKDQLELVIRSFFLFSLMVISGPVVYRV